MTTLRFLVLVSCLYAVNAEGWNYAEKGPTSWNRNPDYPICGLKRQSPVNIELPNTVFKNELTPFDDSLFQFSQGGELLNNGHTIGLGFDGWTIPAGTANFTDSYKAVNLHLHWGSPSSRGSEHTFNNQQAFAELHFVHFNTKYGTLGDAVDKPDGLAVLGVMALKRGNVDNPAFEQLISSIVDNSTRYKNDFTTISNFEFSGLFPSSTALYYRYLGSLTTPACFESVTWTVFNNVIVISERQARILSTQLFEYENDSLSNREIVNNFRPIQPLNGRTVYRSQPGGLAAGATSHMVTAFVMISSLLMSVLVANIL